jgi:putative heme-binding domain-containing protein
MAQVDRVFPKLQFKDPVELAFDPSGSRLWVLEVGGRLVSFAPRAEAAAADVSLDLGKLRSPFAQALGFAFHPGFATNRFLYLVYVVQDRDPAGTRLSRFRVEPTDPPRVEPASEQILLTWMGGGHNGSSLQFGPDGFLYISTGDAASPEPPDVLLTGQNLDDRLSCILRIDVDRPSGTNAFSIPPGNPFIGRQGALPEIWAYGFRNPWRTSFGPDGALWVGDVGWELWETVHRIKTGGYNGGWSRMEGPQLVNATQQPPTPIQEPLLALPHSEFASITGGFFHDGADGLPELKGTYVFGDWETGKIRGLRLQGDQIVWNEELCDTPLKIVAFARDPAGGLLVMDYRPDAGIYRLTARKGQGLSGAFPRRLSETGLFADVAQQVAAPGVVEYAINASQWSDHARARRWVAIPGQGVVKTQVGRESHERRWEFPNQSVLVKTLSLDREAGRPESARPMETQLLHQSGDGWQAYSYRWNEAGTDAELVAAGGAVGEWTLRDAREPGGVRSESWRFASRAECLRCHNNWAGPTLAFNFEQLLGKSDPGEAGRLAHLGVLEIHDDLKSVARLHSPSEETADLESRARSWLHANCAHCHRWGAGGAVSLFLNLDRPLSDSRLVDVLPARGAFGLNEARIIAPGDAWRSVLLYRISTEGAGRMPIQGSRRVDEAGVALVRRWIDSLTSTQAVSPAVRAARSRFAAPSVDSPSLDETSAALAYLGRVAHPESAVVQRALRSTNGPTRDLFGRFLPASQRRRVLGEGWDPAALSGLIGDAQRGRALFHADSGPQCGRCHSAQGVGKSFGPNLDGIASKYDRSGLLDQIRWPSRTVAPEFALHQIETRDGLQYSGFVVSKDAQKLRLQTEGTAVVALPIDTVVTDTVSPVSAMPEGLLDALTAQEVADLLAYLSGLKTRP